jgi:hypothetical protein
MIIKKNLETYMDISDPKDMFSPNRNEMLIAKLTDKFVGVCYMSCYVIKINKIIRRSYIYMKDTLEGDSHTNIMFEVDAIVYQKNEIINGCHIIKKEPNGIIHGKSTYAGIQLSIQPNMSIFKEGDVVPVIVKRVRYNVNQTSMSVLAVPFIPIQYQPTYYSTNGSLSKIQTAELKSLLDQIKIEQSKLKNLNTNDKKIVSFFIDLLSPSKSLDPTKLSITKSKKIDILNILDLEHGILFRPDIKFDDSSIYYISLDANIKQSQNSKSILQNKLVSDFSQLNDVAISKQVNTDTKKQSDLSTISTNIIDESMYNTYYIILTQYINNIQSLQNFLIQYPTVDTIQKNKEIWKMYTMLKK